MATQVPSKPASKASVTKHPLFPAMVALWFGALFGLGSLALRASILESFVLALSLDVLLPAAAPPLGLKARLILALLLAAIGVAVGAYLARRIVRLRPVETPRRRGVASRFASRHDRDEAPVEAETPAARRRSLTIGTDEGFGHHFDVAPLPGGSPSILDVTQIDLTPAPDDALDLRAAGPHYTHDEAPLALDAFIVEEPARTWQAPYQSFAEAEAEPPVDPEADEYARELEALRQVDGPPAFTSGEDAPAVWSDEPPLGSVTGPLAAPWPEEPLPVVPAVLLADPLPLHGGIVQDATAVRRIETAELGELSPVELVERLAVAMRQRANKRPMPGALVDAVSSLVASAPAAVPADVPSACIAPEVEPEIAAPPVPDLLDELPHESVAPCAELEASPPAPVRLALPAALRPIDFSDYADHDDSADLALPPRSFAPPLVAEPVAAAVASAEPEPAVAATLPVVDEAEGEVPEDSYSSLLELGRPNAGRQDFVRIEEPEEDLAAIEPVVIFPGHGARPGLRFAAPDPAMQADQAEPASELEAFIDAAAQTSALADSGGPQLRRFDAPSTTASPAPSSHAGGIRQDPEEAQRALRSALATLQRMSGAA